MESTDQQHQGTYQDTDRSPNLTINHLPDEVLLEIFDYYRRSIDPYDHQWRKKYVWLNLAHMCRRWRAVVFASSSRLDLNIIVGPEKPGHIKTILSGHLPILIDYCRSEDITDVVDYYERGHTTDGALWRMRAALRHRDRVREISFGGWGVNFFGKFIRATNYHFPALEGLSINFPYGRELDIPATFLRGPDQSDLRLRRLGLCGASLASVSGLLLSATALTDLTLGVTAFVDASQGSFLLACLQGMQCLRSLDLTTPYIRRYCNGWSQHSTYSTPKDIVPLLKLTRFHYTGSTIFLNNLMPGLSAPSLQDAHFMFFTRVPLLYLSRVFDNVREEFRSVSVTFDDEDFRLSSSTHSGEIDRCKPSFRFYVNHSPYSIKSINSTPSTKLAMAEELVLFFPSSNITRWEHVFSLREFLRQFRSVKVLRVESVDPFMREVALYLQQNGGEAVLPILEEIELSMSRLTSYSDEEYQRGAAEALAAFEPFVAARERAGRLVKFFHCEQTKSE